MAWTDETRAKAIQMYLDAEPNADNSMEIVKEIAETLDESVNGVRMIISKSGNYITKTPTKSSTTVVTGDKAPRVSKEAAQTRLNAAIELASQNLDTEITSKLTGKAAIYFASILEALNSAN